MCWSELDLDAGIWTLPAARSKNNRAHTITLPPAALEIIRSVPRRACDQLFGSLVGLASRLCDLGAEQEQPR